MAMAARITIVEMENDLVSTGDLDPDHIHVLGVYVDRLVRIPPDGIWDCRQQGMAGGCWLQAPEEKCAPAAWSLPLRSCGGV